MKNISVMDKYDTTPILHKHYTEDISIDDIVNITREFKKLWNDFCIALDNGEVSQVESYAIRLLFGAARPEYADIYLPGLEQIQPYGKPKNIDEYIQPLYCEYYRVLVSNDPDGLNEITEKYGENILNILYAVGTFINIISIASLWINMYCYMKDHPEIFERSHYESDFYYKNQTDHYRTILNNRPPMFQLEPDILVTEPYVIKNAYARSEEFKDHYYTIWDTHYSAPSLI